MPNKKNISYANFLKRIEDTCAGYGMLQNAGRMLVCVSGGADSVCLLKTFQALRKNLNIEIIVANMDHCLRAEESEKESEFVKDLCGKEGLVCVHKKVKVFDESGGGKISVEEKARKERYKFFCSAAREYGCDVIATGHNMDDQAESVIMKFVYGGSISGLAGIPPVREEKGRRIIRPLIRVTRAQIIHFLTTIKQKFMEDSSNKDVKYRRNKVRVELLPFLEKYNPAIRRNLVNISDTLREDIELMEQIRENAKFGTAGCRRVDIKDMVLQPRSLRRDIFREMVINAGGNVKKLTYRHWMDMDILLRSAEKGKTLDLPGKIKAVRTAKSIIFEKNVKKVN